jgi:putative component of toxin-antitoxin plasmid stabilization module
LFSRGSETERNFAALTIRQAGNYGDTKYLGSGVSELRFDLGPG